MLFALLTLAHQGQNQWPGQLADPTWLPHTGYLRQATAIVGKPVVSPKLTWNVDGESPTWSIVNPPDGMVINQDGRLEWDNPTEGQYVINVRATINGETEQTSWDLNVLKTNFANPTMVSTKHIDYIVPADYAAWMKRVNAAKVIDAYYEFGRDLVGGLPCDARQSMMHDPSIGGAHNGIPIVAGTGTFEGTPQEHWKLGFLFHELGHNLNPHIRVDYLESNDNLLNTWLHGMVEFEKIAWVTRMMAEPGKQGTPDVQNFAEWMKAESQEFYSSNYQDYLKKTSSGAELLTYKDGPSVVWAGWVHDYAFTYGGEAVEKVLRCMRRDGLQLDDYPDIPNSSARLTILMTLMSAAAKQNLLPRYHAMRFPVDEKLYAAFYPVAAREVANLPALGINGAVKCPADGHYYALTPYHMSWPEAEATARRLGGHLATIRSKDQEQWLATTYGRSGWIWVGAYRDDANAWHWITGEHPDNPVWEPERPESDPNKRYGVLILHEDGSKNKNGWFGMANRPWDENEIGIMEFEHPPKLDTDSL